MRAKDNKPTGLQICCQIPPFAKQDRTWPLGAKFLKTVNKSRPAVLDAIDRTGLLAQMVYRMLPKSMFFSINLEST